MAVVRNLAIGVLAEQDRSMPPRSGSTAATPHRPLATSGSGSDQTDITQERQSPASRWGLEHAAAGAVRLKDRFRYLDHDLKGWGPRAGGSGQFRMLLAHRDHLLGASTLSSRTSGHP